MEKIVPVMMKLIKDVVSESSIDCSSFMSLTSSEQDSMYSLASSHSIANIIGEAVGSVSPKFQKAAFESVFQYETIQNDISLIQCIFNELEIPYILLKGSRLCKYYPQPWLRSRGDLDILIHKCDIKSAVTELCNHNFIYENDNYHDIHLTSPSGTFFELHFKILENNSNLDVVLSQVWDYSHPVKDSEWEQSNEYFVFHQIAHMAYHFLAGGCGIRPFIDLYVLKNKLNYDELKVFDLCVEAKIDTFYNNVQSLIDIWFGNGEHNLTTKKMEEYILTGGVFGNLENRLLVEEHSNHRNISYYFSRLFLSYDALCLSYPSLKGHRYLLPYYEVKRWCKLLNKSKRKQLEKEFEVRKELSSTSIESVGDLLEQLELK